MPHLLVSLEMAKKWQSKSLSLQLISFLTVKFPTKMQHEMPRIIPAVSPCMTDAKPAITEQAFATMTDVCKICGVILY